MFSDPDLRQRHRTILNRIDGLALLAPCDVGVHAEIPIFVDVINLKNWSTSVGDALGLVEARVAKGTRRTYHVPECATAEQAQRLTRILTQGRCRRATQAMLRQAVPWKAKEHRPDWQAIERLAANYANIDRPCLIICGEWDEILPQSMGHKLKDEIPGARLTRITGCGHSLPTEKPVACAQIVREFVKAVRVGRFDSFATVSRYPELLLPAVTKDLKITAIGQPELLARQVERSR